MDQETTLELEKLQIALADLREFVADIADLTMRHRRAIQILEKPLKDPARVPPPP